MSGALLVTAVVAFAGTTVDDLVILAALFMSGRTTGTPRAAAIVGGQYAGFAAILAVAVLAAAGLAVIPDRWVGLLGLVPVGYGGWSLWRLRTGDGQARPPLAATATRIAAVTFANGADNISVFTPLLRTLRMPGSVFAVALFLVLVGVWCVVGAALGGHRAVVATLGRVSHWLVPAVFIVVGLLILVTSGILATIASAV
ncbi:MAG TPA: cadmium resistance transporter [Rugosimonospora sp.]|nr:cadmium resistance transporter [Rugosimonospora sp.]